MVLGMGSEVQHLRINNMKASLHLVVPAKTWWVKLHNSAAVDNGTKLSGKCLFGFTYIKGRIKYVQSWTTVPHFWIFIISYAVYRHSNISCTGFITYRFNKDSTLVSKKYPWEQHHIRGYLIREDPFLVTAFNEIVHSLQFNKQTMLL